MNISCKTVKYITLVQDILLSLYLCPRAHFFVHAVDTLHFTNRKVNPQCNCLHGMTLLLHHSLAWFCVSSVVWGRDILVAANYKWGNRCNCFAKSPTLTQQQSCKYNLGDQAWWEHILISFIFLKYCILQTGNCWHLSVLYSHSDTVI